MTMKSKRFALIAAVLVHIDMTGYTLLNAQQLGSNLHVETRGTPTSEIVVAFRSSHSGL